MRTVVVNGWAVLDTTRDDLVRALANNALQHGRTLAIALHVSALRMDRATAAALSASVEHVYADGWSVVRLARMAGARDIERATTTYLAPDVLQMAAEHAGRPIRVALIGGPAGLAESAGRALEDAYPVEVVHAVDGFASAEEWPARLTELEAIDVDVLFVGLGHPLEVEWALTHRDELPEALVMTCGGWFGYLTGDERTAPRWVRGVGMEWAFRVAQDPRRLLGRYLRGALDLVSIALTITWGRVDRRRRV